MDNLTEPIIVMQNCLSVLRKINGWTTENLGTRIGVTKQTISNLENWKVTMTKTQYIALRSVFEYEINCIKDNMTLQRIMRILFYSDVKYSKETMNKITEALDNLAAAASGGVSGAQLFLLSTTLLSPLKIPVMNKSIELDEPYVWIKKVMEE